MSKKKGQVKKQPYKNFPFYLITGFAFVLVVTLATVITSEKAKEKEVPKNTTTVEVGKSYSKGRGVIKKINLINKTIDVMDLEIKEDISLYYTGASEFRDKYGQMKTVQQFGLGQIIEFEYDKEILKVSKIIESKNSWIYSDINQWSIDSSKAVLTIASSKYEISKDVVVYREDELLSLEDLDNKDELVVRGDDKTILSIGVLKGHGTISFIEYDDFIGGIAYIGKREVIPITEDMTITAREGTFDIVFELGTLVGTKNVTLLAEDTITVSMEEFKKPPVQMGLVEFDIIPYGADLTIDKEEVSYEQGISLEYGEHRVRVTLGGYTTFEGKLVVGEEESKISIRLVEENGTSGQEDVEVTVESGDQDEISQEGNTFIESETNETKEDNLSPTPTPQSNASNKGYVHIVSPMDVSIYIDGEFLGNSPVSFKKEEGTHYITLIKDGYETITYTVVMEEDSENTLSFPSMIKSE